MDYANFSAEIIATRMVFSQSKFRGSTTKLGIIIPSLEWNRAFFKPEKPTPTAGAMGSWHPNTCLSLTRSEGCKWHHTGGTAEIFRKAKYGWKLATWNRFGGFNLGCRVGRLCHVRGLL